MSGISTRIKIKNVEGADIAFLYQKETLEQIGLFPSKSNPDATSFNVGDEFSLEETKYRVLNIYTVFFKQTEPDNKGTNLYALDEEEPFNFQITYEVERINQL
jgi:hypothetical protein